MKRFMQVSVLGVFIFFIYIQQVNAQSDRPSQPEIATPVTQGRIAQGTRFMMVTAHPAATRVGAQILKEGGSAVDAAIAAQMVLGLVEPQSSGIGGGGFALHYDAARKKITSFDGRETAPATAGKYLFLGKNGEPLPFYDAAVGGRAVGVPGVLRLAEELHKKYGVKPWRELFSPAITMAENGFTVTPRLARMIDYDSLHLKIFTPTKLYFFPDVLTPLNEGARRHNPAYADILRKVALNGADAFYTGDNAETLVKAVREDFENPGLLSLEDLAGYKAIERKPVCIRYRLHLVCSMGEPSGGGLSLLMALGILEQFNMASYGPDSPTSWHLIAEASRLALADTIYYMGDPHYVQSPGEDFLDPSYIEERSALISPQKASPSITFGVPPRWKALIPEQKPDEDLTKPPGTTQIVAVDRKGNMVSMTTSIEDMFGSRLFVNGYLLNNQLTDFSFVPEVDGKLVANRVEGGKRPRSMMAPVMVFAPDGAPLLVTGSAGGSAIMGYILPRIIGVIDWRQGIEEAVAAPNIIHRGKEIEIEEGAADLAQPLRGYGHPVTMKELNSGLSAIHKSNGLMIGVADPRREGVAQGE